MAAALVRAQRARLPEPEELLSAGAPPERREGPRQGFEDTLWFRIDVGRRHNADPRWILPLLCRRGHITKAEVGAIRIQPAETQFEVPRAVADKFVAAWRRSANKGDPESNIALDTVRGGAPRPAPRRPHSR